MPDVQKLIEKQRAKVDSLRVELVAAEKVLAMLDELLADDDQPKTAPTLPPVHALTTAAALDQPDNYVIDLAAFDTPGPKRVARLIEGVRSTVKQFGDQEFTAGMTEKAMRALNVPIPGGENPTSKISIHLAELASEGLLTKVYVGAGNVPHRYRLTSTLPESERVALQEQKSPANIATGQDS